MFASAGRLEYIIGRIRIPSGTPDKPRCGMYGPPTLVLELLKRDKAVPRDIFYHYGFVIIETKTRARPSVTDKQLYAIPMVV